MKDMVSVIVPCYNYGKFLPATLDSLRDQTCGDWNCIIVDDGSVDDTAQVVREYQSRDKRFRYYYQMNKGLSAARNLGIRHATGEFLQFLDADDMLEREKLKYQVKFLDQYKDVDLVYSGVRYFLDDPVKVPEEGWMPEISGKGDDFVAVLLKKNIMPVNSVLMRRSSVRYGFDESLRALEDWYFWLQHALSGCKFAFESTDNTNARVRLHAYSMSKNLLKMVLSETRIRRKLASALPLSLQAENKELDEVAVRNIVMLAQQEGFKCLRENKMKEGVNKLWIASRYSGNYFFYLKHSLYWYFKGNGNNA